MSIKHKQQQRLRQQQQQQQQGNNKEFYSWHICSELPGTVAAYQLAIITREEAKVAHDNTTTNSSRTNGENVATTVCAFES